MPCLRQGDRFPAAAVVTPIPAVAEYTENAIICFFGGELLTSQKEAQLARMPLKEGDPSRAARSAQYPAR
jgi:hypothetical protein